MFDEKKCIQLKAKTLNFDLMAFSSEIQMVIILIKISQKLILTTFSDVYIQPSWKS